MSRRWGLRSAVSQGNLPAVAVGREHPMFGMLEARADIACAPFSEPLPPFFARG